MSNYIGLDVSLKTTSICIMNQIGKIMQQMTVATDPKIIFDAITSQNISVEKVALDNVPPSTIACHAIVRSPGL